MSRCPKCNHGTLIMYEKDGRVFSVAKCLNCKHMFVHKPEEAEE